MLGRSSTCVSKSHTIKTYALLKRVTVTQELMFPGEGFQPQLEIADDKFWWEEVQFWEF